MAERTAASTYYKSQKRFLMQYLDKTASTTTQSVSISVKVVSNDIQKSCSKCMNHTMLHVPDPTKIPKGSVLVNSFKKRLSIFRNHFHTGITTLAMGEVFVGLEGSFRVAGCPIGSLAGDLKAQLATLGSLDEQGLKAKCDFMMEYSSCAPVKGHGVALVIPPGYIYVMNSPQALCVSWSFGMSEPGSRQVVKTTLSSLFKSWPQCNAGEYATFSEWLSMQG
jgi:hypothetical protein